MVPCLRGRRLSHGRGGRVVTSVVRRWCAFLVVCWAVVACGGGGTSPSASVVPTAKPTPTADPAVDQVKAAVEAYARADIQSGISGDAGPVHQLCLPGSQADSVAGNSETISRETHRVFVPTTLTFASWTVSVAGSSASVRLVFDAVGHDARWPGLQSLDPDHDLGDQARTYELQEMDGRWLVSRVG
jgi:hypothetical protein